MTAKTNEKISYIGIEKARADLGPLVNQVAKTGSTVVLTRNGFPVAKIVPFVYGEEVLKTMYRRLLSQHGPCNVAHQTYIAAALLLGENEADYDHRPKARVTATAELGIKLLCAALGVDADEIDEQPPELATAAQARDVIARIVDVSSIRSVTPMSDDVEKLEHLVDPTGDED